VFRSLFGAYRARTLFALAVGFSVLLMSLDAGSRFDVARRLGASIYAPVQAVAAGAEEILTVHNENKKLRRVVATLNLERQRLLQFRDQVDELRRVAGFAAERFPMLEPCQVIGRSTDHFQNMLQLACGSADSLSQDMPVTTYAGLVGRIRQVSGEHALIETLTSPNMAVSTLNQRSGVIGILRWARGHQFRLESVDAVEDVLVGDPLVSSGLGGVYPRGIPVGVVTRVATSLDGLFKDIEVRPYVDFSGLNDVFVVRGVVDWQYQALYDTEEARLLEELTQRKSNPAEAGRP